MAENQRVLEVVVLGTGASVGVPVVGCACPVCTSPDERNRRMKPSIWLRCRDRSILIDTSTDLRHQALRFGIERLDAILYTHAHADHVLGLDDIRIYNFRQREPIPIYASEETFEGVARMFWYIFAQTQEGGGKPKVYHRAIHDAPFSVFGVPVVPIPVHHGNLHIHGFRLGPFAYVTDCSHLPDASARLLEGVDTLLLNALRYTKHPTHNNLEETLALIERLGPRTAYLTHMTHEMDHDAVEAQTPDHVHPAYDGLRLRFPLPGA